MTQTPKNERIKQAFTHATPNVLPSVLLECKEKKESVIIMTEKKRVNPWIKRIASAAAVFVLVAGVFVGTNAYNVNNKVASIISLDVNPSIEIRVNQKENVLEVNPLNEDGRTVVGDMDFKGSSLDVTVNALIGSMLREGFISEISNSILISVENSDLAKSAELQNKLTNEISKLLQTNKFDGAVLSQTISSDDDLVALAETYGITLGKAQLISQIHEQNDRYTYEKLIPLSINELNLLRESGHLQLKSVTSVGTASDKAYIGQEKAKEIALSHAGVSASNISDYSSELEYEDGVMVYEIEFDSGNTEYDYEINAITGAIVKAEKDWDDDDDDYDIDDDDDDDVAKDPTTQSVATTMLSAANARQAVLDRFGGIIQKIEYAYDDTNPHYKGEALKNGSRVVFELNARTQSFTKWDVGNDNTWDKFSSALPNMITLNQAVNLVIAKSGQSNTFVQKIDFNWDDSEPLYQGEAFNKGVKYSFEIKAYGGDFHKWDASNGDDTWNEQYYNVK